MTKISIITSVYNSEKYLEECINSVLKQDFNDFEHILVNDGSNDSSLDILKKYEKNDSRIKVINSKNKGQGIQKNYALTLATGDYVLYLDSDDWLNNGALRKIYNRFEDCNCDIVIFNAYRHFQLTQTDSKYIFNDCFFSRFKEKVFHKEDALDILFNINALAFKAYKRSLLAENNILFSISRFIEDSPFFIKAMLLANTYSCINDFLVYYRIIDNSTSSKAYLHTDTIKKIFFETEDIFYSYYANNKNEKLLSSFLNNRITQLRYYFENLKKNKKTYYTMMKQIFSYIENKYGNDFLYLNPNKIFFENVKNLNYFQYNLHYTTGLIKANLGSYLDIV